jgi:phage terminase small subunit
LNARHQRFVAEYLIDQNAAAAYRRAGYKATEGSARVNASRLLTNADIRAAIATAQGKILDKLELTAERVLQELARIAFFDARKMFDGKGNPIPLHELDSDTAAVINGLDVLEETEGSGKDRVVVGYVKKYKLADKNTALGNALKVLGLLREKVEVNDTTPADKYSDIELARRAAFLFAKASRSNELH